MQSQEINENPTVQDFIKELKHIRTVPEHSLIGTNLWVEALQDRLLPLKVLIQGFLRSIGRLVYIWNCDFSQA